MQILNQLKFDSNGLIPAIAQDAITGEVLMVAYMNEAAVRATIETKKATYWSRSRQKFWIKGESSGHFQIVHSMYVDCDQDCILLKIDQKGAACHTGFRSCFYRKVDDAGNELITEGEPLVDPNEVYGKK
ncbi:MAG: phosphoribosyl-AMP cyclohydrolase [Armatimonadota bacterium]